MSLGTRERALSPLLQAAILVAITVFILFLRRPDQFLHPYIWVEEGKWVLRDYLDSGLWVLTKPLVGYSQLASKIIAYLSFKTSILWAPEIAMGLTVVFTCAVILAVALSPTHLRWPFLCALAVLLVPTDAETFAVSAYAFWWAGILLLVAVFWDHERGDQWLRWLYLIFGGLSSPIIGAVAAAIGARALFERRPSEIYAFGIAAAAALVQALILRSFKVPLSTETLGLRTMDLIVRQYIGGFFYNHGGLLLGLSVLALLLVSGWLVRSRLDRYFALLVLTFLLTCVSVSLRVPIAAFAVLDQFDIGPRYFFYPFILFSWILVWLASLSAPIVRAGFAIAFLAALAMAGSHLSRRHDAVDWRQHVLACAQSDKYMIPFHYIGHADKMWTATFTGEECRRLLRLSIF